MNTLATFDVYGEQKIFTHSKRIFYSPAKRHVGATQMNEKSSRSHSIFRVIIESKERDIGEMSDSDDAVKVSHLVSVDFIMLFQLNSNLLMHQVCQVRE